MEEKEEFNALGRSQNRKIKTVEKYKGEKPGSLHIKVTYQTGCLTVSLGQASLAGKRSQDPYAMVYLLPPQSSKVLFEIGNNKTKVFDRNIEPAFNSDFQFRISYEEIVQRSLSLVVAIWDSDSNSRDDYMAGFRAQFPPTQLPATSKWELIQLKHQEPDGHPASISFGELVPSGSGRNTGGQPGSAPYPGGQPGSSPYPGGQPGSSPYPGGQPGSSPYPGGQPGGSPYPGGQPGSSPYPGGQPGGSPYPGGQPGGSPYPGGQPGGSPYPGGQPGQPGGSPYPGGQPSGSPYPGGQPGGSHYPEVQSGTTPYPGKPGAPYPK